MSGHEERNDAAYRRLLSRYPRPALTTDFADGVLRRVREHERARERQRHLGARLVLGAYWLAAALASAWLLARTAWPEWVGPVAWGLAMAGAPLAYAITLFPERARACLALGTRPLLPPLER
jgi:hypothetical protein